MPEADQFDPAAHGWSETKVGTFMTSLGPIWTRGEGSAFESGLLTSAKHSNHRDIVHGGVIMSFADYGIGMVASKAYQDLNQVTLQLDVSFVSAARLGAFLVARGEVIRATKSLVFVRGQIMDGDTIVASANGIWKTVRPK